MVRTSNSLFFQWLNYVNAQNVVQKNKNREKIQFFSRFYFEK